MVTIVCGLLVYHQLRIYLKWLGDTNQRFGTLPFGSGSEAVATISDWRFLRSSTLRLQMDRFMILFLCFADCSFCYIREVTEFGNFWRGF
jgi:hypothetical protein